MSEPTSTIDHGHHPKGPNFLLIVILCGVFIILGFIAAYFILDKGGKHLVPGKHDPHPTSELVVPALRSSSPKNTSELPFIFTQQTPKTCV